MSRDFDDDQDFADFDEAEEEEPRRRRRHKRNREERRGLSRRTLRRGGWLAAGMLTGALMLAALQAYTGAGLPAWASGNFVGGPDGAGSGPVRSTVRGASSRGSANASVLMVEYSDFQCPFCRKFFKETKPTIDSTYVATGKVRFVYKHLAILGQESIWAAEASECAADQGRFWDMHDELFRQAEAAGGENVGAFTKDKLNKYAQALNFDTGRFASCLSTDATLSRVNNDTREGQGLGFNGTPSFWINGQTVVGAQPLSEYLKYIDPTAGK